MNKNKIDTAPIYTIKYEKPINVNPDKIKYTDIDPNKPIKDNKEAIGFLLTITAIPKNNAITLIISRNSTVYPPVKTSCTENN
jgi:hypothetical protein